MADPVRIVTAPLGAPSQPDFASLAAVVAADAVVRQAWAAGRPADLVVPVLAGELQSHHALERELARQGLDRRALAPDDYDARATAFAADCLRATTARLAALGVGGTAVHLSPEAGEVVGAARTAFVTLYEQGLVDLADRVVPTCPHCRTALDGADVAAGEVAGERITVRLGVEGRAEGIEVGVDHAELLPGVVAVAVPEGHPATGTTAHVPVSDRAVPVVGAGDRAEPWLVVPAHDPAAHALAVGAGLPALRVLDAEGVVSAPGPLEGLARYAARAGAAALLRAEGAVTAAGPVLEEVVRCSCCGTTVVPQLGRHWVLRSGDLEVAAADAVRAGLVAFSPPEAREAFLACVGARREWLLGSSVGGGVPVPAAGCHDCGRLAVEAAPASSCGACMGQLEPDAGTLDARFVAAAWALSLAGWPGRRERGAGTAVAPSVAAVATPDDLGRWVLPAMALGLRLAGTPVFGQVTVHPWLRGDERPAPALFDAGVDRRVARLALVAGTGDLAAAAAAVAALDSSPAPATATVAAVAAAAGVGAGGGGPVPGAIALGEDELAEVTAAVAGALGGGMPAMAAGLLLSSLGAGVRPEAAVRLRALASPILGE